MPQRSYGKKIWWAGGRGVSLQIRRAVLAQLLGVLGHMYNDMYNSLLSKELREGTCFNILKICENGNPGTINNTLCH